MAASLLPIDGKSLQTDCKLNSRQLNRQLGYCGEFEVPIISVAASSWEFQIQSRRSKSRYSNQ
jgi:hypothetical protein